MKTFKASLTEATKSQVVVSFGRMNPMTNGHEKLADKIKEEAKKRNADAKLYLSHSTNPKKDPLDFKTKVKFAKKAFGPMVQNSVARTIIEVAKELSGKYDDLIVVVGSDSRIGNKYFKYGFGYGGPCLPRDNKALYIYIREITDVDTPQITKIIKKLDTIRLKLFSEFYEHGYIKM